MSGDARASLAADQAKLVAALGGRGDVPPGFGASSVQVAARTLLAKRRKGVARTWPLLAESLGEQFVELFGACAASRLPHPAGPAADGLAFAQWLDRRRLLPDVAVPGFIRARLWRGRTIGLSLRRVDGRILAGVRLPFVGVRVLSVPWRR